MRIKRLRTRFLPSFRAIVASVVLGAISVSVGFSFSVEDTKTNQNSECRSIREYRLDVKTFMKLSKRDDAQIQRNAIFNLCELHWELVNDPRLETNQQVQGFRVVIANRLEAFAKEVEKQQLRSARLAWQNRKNGSDETRNEETRSNAPPTERKVSDSAGPSHVDEGEAMYQSSSDAYYSMGQLTGGPNQLFGYAGGRLGPPWDHGPDLVNLIQNTINPDFWRANGGNGVIHYFRPLRVLVIGASTQVHQDTLDLLYKLRSSRQ